MPDQQLKPQDDFWEGLIEALPEAALVAAIHGPVLCANGAALTLLGYSEDELGHLGLEALLPHPQNQAVVERLARAEKTGQTSTEVLLRRKDGSDISVLMAFCHIRGHGQGQDALLITLRDFRIFRESMDEMERENLWLGSMFDNLTDALFLAPISKDGIHQNFVEVNETACRRLGYSREELLNMNARTVNPSANLDRVRSFGRQIQREGGTIFKAIHEAKDGTQIPVEVVARRVTINDQDYVLSVARDLRDHILLQNSEMRFGQLMDYSWHEIYIFKSESLDIVLANQGALDNLGFNKQEIMQQKFTDILPKIDVAEFDALSKPLFDGTQGLVMFESEMRRKDGSYYPVEIRIQLSHSEVPPVFFANVQDITERKKTESRLKFLANYDSLTELPNRSLFLDRLKIAIENTKRINKLAAVIFLDLDGFKAVNDTLGHIAGDQLIREVGQRLLGCVRKSDTVARLGGDEFTVLLTNLDHIDGVDCVADKILVEVSKPYVIAGHKVSTTPSLGITLCPFDDSDDAEVLIKQADTAMYQAKAKGKNNYVYYQAALGKEELRKTEIEGALKYALEYNEFELYYQPRVNLETHDIIGAEALLRWNHPKLGFISPVEFIPLLESNGHIKQVGAWVLETACKQLSEWLGCCSHLRISINVSARQFEQEAFSKQLTQVIQETGVPATNIEIEITEGFFLSNTEHAADMLRGLKETGVTISLDDFGTGYSSLSYLKQLPIDILKIDRSFVMDLNHNTDSSAIVDAIIGLARSLGLKVTAEGIEENEQAAFLASHDCHEGQGYLFGRPMPADEFEQHYFSKTENSCCHEKC
jgi:diguanylate cyclase (GGDEF)-like protein/PAS domain S-box-containing protein